MFVVRPYEDGDLQACSECLREGFFDCPVTENDMDLLRDYARILMTMSSFALVAETGDGLVAGFICGKYDKRFARSRGIRTGGGGLGFTTSRMLKYLVNGYGLSEPFRGQFRDFLRQAREGGGGFIGECDLELLAITSRREFRKGLGTALLAGFLDRAREDGAGTVRVFTNTLASWEFYERRGFERVAEKPFPDGSGNLSLVYSYRLRRRGGVSLACHRWPDCARADVIQ